MKTFFKNILPWILIIFFVGISYTNPYGIFTRTVTNTETDTVRVDVPYEVEVIKEKLVPKKVTVYRDRIDTVEKVVLKRDTVTITTTEQTDINYNTQFLTQYANRFKFLGSNLSYDNIDLTYLNLQGISETQSWDVDFRQYQYQLGYAEDNNIALKKEKIPYWDFLINNTEHSIAIGYNFMTTPYVRYNLSVPVYYNLSIVPEIEIGESFNPKIELEYKF